MRTVSTVLVLFLASSTIAEEMPQRILRPFEVKGFGGFSEAPGAQQRFSLVGVSASFGTPILRGFGSVAHSWIHKIGTSGGYQRSYSYGLETGVRNFFLFAGANHNFTDQTQYTKTVNFRFGGMGYRRATGWDGVRPIIISEVRVSYDREYYSTYANQTELFSVSYGLDRKLYRALYLHWRIQLGEVHFNESPYPEAQRLTDFAGSFHIGLVVHP